VRDPGAKLKAALLDDLMLMHGLPCREAANWMQGSSCKAARGGTAILKEYRAAVAPTSPAKLDHRAHITAAPKVSPVAELLHVREAGKIKGVHQLHAAARDMPASKLSGKQQAHI